VWGVLLQIASAALDQLPVPYVGGGTILNEERVAAARAAMGGGEEEDGPDAMDVDGGEAGKLRVHVCILFYRVGQNHILYIHRIYTPIVYLVISCQKYRTTHRIYGVLARPLSFSACVSVRFG
jgi:hypothetical protein